jgi:ribonuclease HIII
MTDRAQLAFNHILPVSEPEVKVIRTMLKRRGFVFTRRESAYFSARKDGLHVTVYKRGPKALVQGNGAQDFSRSILEPFLAKAAGGEIPPTSCRG